MWPFIPRVIEKFLDLANLQRHNDNYNDIKSALEDLAGTGRTNETIKGTSDTLNNHLADKANPHDVTAAQVGAYSKTELQTSGQSSVHWDNLTNKPNFADARWGAPVANKDALDAIVATQDGEVRLVLQDETVYEWDAEIVGANKWRAIGAIGNGLTSHSALTNLANDDHLQYLRTDGTRVLTGDQDFGQREAKNLIIHKAPTAPANPVEGQPWYDTTNHSLMLYKGAVQGWVDISGKGAIIRDQEFTALAGQTVFDITVGQYEIGTNALTLYKRNAEGKFELVPESEYTETNPTRFTLTAPAVGGEVFYVKFFENSPEVINQSVKRDGTLQTNLNAEFLNGHPDTYFATKTEVTTAQETADSRQLENIGYGIQSGLNVLASGVPDRNVHVQAGVAYLADGSRKVYSAVTTIQLQSADATNPRKDMIYLDQSLGIIYAAGIPSPTPSEPSLPAGGIKLCVIDVPANDNTIDQAQITDSRILKTKLSDLKQTVDGLAGVGRTTETVKGNADALAAHLAEKASDGVHGLATTANITYYVNVATGNDGNDGLTSGTAFKTIQAAINKLPQIINHTVTINLAAGTYPEHVTVAGFVGKGSLTIKGDSAVSTSYSCLAVTVNNCYLFVDIRGLYSTATDRTAFTAQNCPNTRFIHCNVVTAAQYGYLFADASGYVSICNASNRSSGIRAAGPCVVVSEANTGSGNTIALQAIYAATIGKVGTQPTGTTAESPGQGGVIR